jgi:hypothetical protein
MKAKSNPFFKECPICKGKAHADYVAHKMWSRERARLIENWEKAGSNQNTFPQLEKDIADIPSPVCQLCKDKGYILTPKGEENIEVFQMFA